MQQIKKKKNKIKIPNNISILFCNKKKIITIIGPLKKKSFKLTFDILLSKTSSTLQVSFLPFSKMSNYATNKQKTIQGTTLSLIKQLIIESSVIFYKKLKLIGVGYRVFNEKDFNNRLLLFKLGYSHFIYQRAPNKLSFFCFKKSTKLYIYGNSSYQEITQTAANIRYHKKPEPYKGKGILYENEKIILKEGKKV
jgi:large subunit ribosomal protein L6